MEKLDAYLGEAYALNNDLPTTNTATAEEALKSRRKRRAHHFGALGLVVFGLLIWNKKSVSLEEWQTHPQAQAPAAACNSSAAAPEFDWSKIEPSETLVWHACFDKFQCARLTVPLDYSEPEGEKAAVALTKFPAVVPPSDKSYRGPILFNPGGPGGSGVDLIKGRAELFQKLLGDDYDLIGFDPRGVGHTTPPVRTLSDLEEEAWNLQITHVGDANASPDFLGRQYALAQVLGKLALDKSKHAAEHVSTAVVARDMLSIMRAHGREKLQYWGFSYGTVLGATFAAMFPNNVGRLIIDGVVDSDNYYATLWDNNLRDTDAELRGVYEDCVNAGPSVCPLYEKTANDVEKRVKTLMTKLQAVPLPFYNITSGAYDVIDGTDVKKLIFATMYKPYTLAKNMFNALAELEKGNATIISELYSRSGWNAKLTCKCPTTPSMVTGGSELHYAIACGDGEVVDDGIPELQKHVDRMSKDTPFFSGLWTMRTACSGWKIRATETFRGPFVANTSHPLLLIGNTADPVTPLWNAHKMSKGFKDSVVLTQNSAGHCSLSATSLCTGKYIREYFRDGKLPPNGTRCDVESSVFGENLMETSNLEELDATDQAILEASRALQEDYFVPMFKLF